MSASQPLGGVTPGAANANFDALLQQERIIQSAMLPASETPTCMDLFDKWAMCFALVPQFRNIYRYGSLNDCATKMDDFKFCLTLRGTDEAQRRQAWIERKARHMARRRMTGGNTSEEIWELRDQPLVAPEFVDEAFLPQAQQQQSQANSDTSSKSSNKS